ncbi:MAG: peptide chain release factor-like protein [Planctomycetota bacterium]
MTLFAGPQIQQSDDAFDKEADILNPALLASFLASMPPNSSANPAPLFTQFSCPHPMSSPANHSSGAELPAAGERMDCRFVEAPHPATELPTVLLEQCELRTQRRSGPGGQHRNKTSSGSFLTHRPTQLVAEATERRSQAENREVALQRLRFILAIEVRTRSPLDDPADSDSSSSGIEAEVRKRFSAHPLKLNDANDSKPAVLALLLNDLWVAGGQPSLVAPAWSVSTSKIVGFLRSHPAAITWVNRVRTHHGRKPLH